MPEETQYLGRSEVKGSGYMEPNRYRVKCRCLRCGHVYSRIIKRISDPDPPCPKKACKEAIAAEQSAKEAAHVEAMIETGETPGHVGANVQVKAIDETAKIVMEDYKMSDLKDNTRRGENSVPGLTPAQRAMSKNFWGGGRQRDRKTTFQPGLQAKNKELVDNAMAGKFGVNYAKSQPSDAVTGDHLLRDLHNNRIKPNVDIIFDSNKAKKR